MLHVSREAGPWFRAKSYGYGSGLPITWQGWLFMAAHLAVIAGVAVAAPDRPVVTTLLVIAAGLAPLPIYRARTAGGWHWRWGKADAPQGNGRNDRS